MHNASIFFLRASCFTVVWIERIHHRRCERLQAKHKSGHQKDAHEEELGKGDRDLLPTRISHTEIGAVITVDAVDAVVSVAVASVAVASVAVASVAVASVAVVAVAGAGADAAAAVATAPANVSLRD
jgi:hypothetical protein